MAKLSSQATKHWLLSWKKKAMDGSMNNTAETMWQADYLRQLASDTPFTGATQHWQDKALSCFIEDGLPTAKMEAWRYTNLYELEKSQFILPQVQEISSDLDNFCIEDSYRVVFINGSLQEKLSSHPEDVFVLPIGDMLATADETLLREFRLELDKPFFACLNSALMREGCYIKVKPNITLDKPLHILHVSTQEDSESIRNLRFFVDVDRNSEITVLEEHVCLGQQSYFNNVVTQLNLNFDSRLNYYKYQRDSRAAYHMSTTIASLSADSNLYYYSLSDGAKLNREDILLRHYERGSYANLVGFYNAKADSHTIHHTRADHFKGHCSTDQYYKGMARDKSRAVFEGQMVVHPGANQSSIHQSNQNLLLSNKAEIDTKPNLEIYTDDVVASHGATVGQLDEKALFYLQSRGISEEQAREILMAGFVRSIFDEMPDNQVTAYLQDEFLGELKDV
jgi:Fe-S cluster assembly protein SufD